MFAPFRRAPLAGLTAHGLLRKPSAELPSFEAASFFTARHSPPIAAVSKDRAFEAQCVCPKPFADRENYALVENGKPLGVS